jgi:hypothetical protein
MAKPDHHGATPMHDRARAGAAGAGVGTFIVLVAESLPPHSPWRPWLIYSAPTLSVAVGAIAFWFQRRLAQYVSEIEFRSLLKGAEAHLRAQLQIADLPESEKPEIQQALSELRRAERLRYWEKIKAFRVLGPPSTNTRLRSGKAKGAQQTGDHALDRTTSE